MAHFSLEERHYIEFQIRDGVSRNQIGIKLGRSQGSISRELEVASKDDANFWPVREYVVWFAHQ